MRVDKERRKHQRHKIENSVMISETGIFQITDISKGGFCFRCPLYTSISEFWETDILTSVERLEGVSVKRAWVAMPENNSHTYLPTVVGIQFGKLTLKQETILSQIIQELSQDDGSMH